jgi:hypothetical protein
MPKYGGCSTLAYGGRSSLPVIRLLFFSEQCLSKMILFIVLAKSAVTSFRSVVVSAEDLPRRALVF